MSLRAVEEEGKPMTFLESVGVMVAVVGGCVLLVVLMMFVAAGLYIGWHGFGPWLLTQFTR